MLFAQQPASLSNLRKKNIHVISSLITIDSLSIVPGTFSIPGIKPEAYLIDEINAVLSWKIKPATDSIRVMYRVFPYKLNAAVKGFSYDSIRFHFLAEPIIVPASSKFSTSFIDFGSLQSEGSIGRSLSFGNAQDAVVNSSMNLQLHGFIGDSLELRAAITDNNLPIQPDGNTQDLRDFDRIFIQVKKKGWQASFGDIDLKENKDYFLSFNKRLQGASFSTLNKLGKNKTNFFEVSGAIAKGKFNRNIITPLEGNQGPYRLKGANNELYFTVMAGTERVYIDGEILQRGEDQDYVINYNAAEITFTANRLIKKDSRIQVEFEYADRNFLNSQLYIQDEYSKDKKFNIRVSAYSNTDSKSSTIDQPLDNAEKQFLYNIGDSISNAYYKNEVLDQYAAGKLLYKKIDTLYNGTIYDSIFVLSADSTIPLYNISFSYIGPGKGNYSQLLNTTNGRSFKWVVPDVNNNKSGDWEPVTLLVTPKKQQVITVGIKYELSPHTIATADWAMSNYDVNLYASKDKGNNIGQAYKATLQQDLGSISISGTPWQMSAGAGYEYTAKTFKPVERLRNVEFLRDWSLANDLSSADEQLANAFLLLKSKKGSRFRYDVTSYNRKDDYAGLRHILDEYLQAGSWQITGRINMMNFTQASQKGNYFRPYAEIKKLFPKMKKYETSFKYLGEYNKVDYIGLDSLSRASFGFDIFEFNIKSSQDKLNKWGFTYFRRQDKMPDKSSLVMVDKSDNYQLGAELLKNQFHQLRLNLNYRKLNIENESLSKLKPDESLLGRLEYSINALNGFASGNIFYEVGSGQELKREFSYVAVPAGQGQYTWIDYNNNGIEELNEFELAVFQDQKKYIRIYTPGNTYVKANYLQFNYNIELNPKSIIKKDKGLARLLYRSSTSSALQINKKNEAKGNFLFNPFISNLNDTALITLSNFLSNTYYYNRTSSRWGFEFTHSLSTGKSLLVYGYESRKLENINAKLRTRLSKSWLFNVSYKGSINLLATSNLAFSNRNYNIAQHGVAPSLTYVYKSNLRIVFTYAYSEKKNKIDLKESTLNHDLSAELKYNILSGSSLNTRFSYSNFKWKGTPGTENSTIGFILLDGLSAGKNYLWNIDFTKRIGNNLEMNIQYEGRKPGEAKVVHIGRAGIRAMF